MRRVWGGGDDEMAMVGGETGDVESVRRERVFTVGEVVEFWEGAFVLGYRQAPGAPAFVKRVEGNGLYSIKMIGSNTCLERGALIRMFVGQIAGE
jgi:hypothetical protein